MIEHAIRAKFEEFDLSGIQSQDLSVVIPTVSATKFSRFGTHAYYFLNLKTRKGICIKVRHKDIILPGLKKLADANYKKYRYLPRLRLLFQNYHHGYNFIGQILVMTHPHAVVEIESGQFIISLWSYFGYLVVDLKKRTVVYRIMDENDDDHVFGSQQCYEADSDSLYYMTYSLKDSLKKIVDPHTKVFSRILKRGNKTGEVKEIWSGYFSDYMHDLLISENKRYMIACEFGKFSDEKNNLIPSKRLILDLETKKEWIFPAADGSAHAQFDPDDPETSYFSAHNMKFVHSPRQELFKKGVYAISLFGPASVHKFRFTSEGPKEIGVFSEPDLFRLTNFHVFKHRGQKILAAIGTPNFIFIADAEQMKLIKKIKLEKQDASFCIGTIAPSHDGEKLYIQTNKSFQILDIESEQNDFIRHYEFTHICFNHMMTSKNTDW